MTFPYTSASLAINNWNMRLYRNGVRVELPIQLQEEPAGYYNFSFVNNGSIGDVFELIINKGGDLKFFLETWKVESPAPESILKEMRANNAGLGGFFGSQKKDK